MAVLGKRVLRCNVYVNLCILVFVDMQWVTCDLVPRRTEIKAVSSFQSSKSACRLASAGQTILNQEGRATALKKALKLTK
jgi:hypothetical protein